MPEGHLLHHHARRHRAELVGAAEVTSPQGRFDAERVQGRLVDVDVHGKHLFHLWDDGAVVHVHLGKRGLFLEAAPPAAEPRPQVRMRVVGPRLVCDLIAPMVCELTDAGGQSAIVQGLGPDPLRPDADREAALDAIGRTSRAIGTVLLDQSVLAGVGNALRADGLNLAGIHPATPASSLEPSELEHLWDVLTDLMRRSAEDGRIPHTVYRQDRCTRCGTPVVTSDVGGRTAYHCPRHQPVR
ncbi:MAG: Fpg/Nei family DNA glycosylase [Actinobacteria bacterium]|nr:Fpg/Nei family DNA glycosylase [Actinomycetota bacterium]